MVPAMKGLLVLVITSCAAPPLKATEPAAIRVDAYTQRAPSLHYSFGRDVTGYSQCAPIVEWSWAFLAKERLCIVECWGLGLLQSSLQGVEEWYWSRLQSTRKGCQRQSCVWKGWCAVLFLGSKKTTLSPWEISPAESTPQLSHSCKRLWRTLVALSFAQAKVVLQSPFPLTKYSPGHQSAAGISYTDVTKGAVQFRRLVVTLGQLWPPTCETDRQAMLEIRMIILKSIAIYPIGNHWGFNPKPVVWKYFQEKVKIFKSIRPKMIFE